MTLTTTKFRFRSGEMRMTGAVIMTAEALMFSLRERGTAALKEPATLRRLAQCTDEQAIEVGKRLRGLKHHIGLGPWSDDEIKELFRARP
jgi:hypothetical protein